MPKYLLHASYTKAGLKGLLKEGGSKRREAVEQAVKGLGGTLEAFYYAFGDTDVFAITDLPDNVTSTALALIVNSAGMVTLKTTVLCLLPPRRSIRLRKRASTIALQDGSGL